MLDHSHHFFDLSFLRIIFFLNCLTFEDVLPEIEHAFLNGIPLLSHLHVLIHLHITDMITSQDCPHMQRTSKLAMGGKAFPEADL